MFTQLIPAMQKAQLDPFTADQLTQIGELALLSDMDA